MAGILGTGIQDGLLLKPVHYKWAMDLYDQAVANTWFPNEIQLGQDLSDWKKMTDEERHALEFLMSYFNPNELLVNKALAFGVYPYVNAAECHLYLAKQMWEEANHCMSFEYVLETFPIDRDEAYAAHVETPSMARKEEFETKFIKRMTEETLDITTTDGKNPSAEYETASRYGETCESPKSFQKSAVNSPEFHKRPSAAVNRSRKSGALFSRVSRCRTTISSSSA